MRCERPHHGKQDRLVARKVERRGEHSLNQLRPSEARRPSMWSINLIKELKIRSYAPCRSRVHVKQLLEQLHEEIARYAAPLLGRESCGTVLSTVGSQAAKLTSRGTTRIAHLPQKVAGDSQLFPDTSDGRPSPFPLGRPGKNELVNCSGRAVEPL